MNQPPDKADLIWAEAERTGKTDTLCAATGLVALVESAIASGMPQDIVQHCLRLITPPLCKGLDEDPPKFAEFMLDLSKARRPTPGETAH